MQTPRPPQLSGWPDLGRCRVMGVVNVTPDSFSDGGEHLDPDDAVAHGLLMREEGADLVDVGGESTRPGALRVAEDEELRRVLPVVRALTAQRVVVSIDTMRASVAEQALDAGAALVNDVSGGLADPLMLPLVARTGAAYVAMHWRGHSVDMAKRAVYDNVVADVQGELRARLDALDAAGVDLGKVVLDPGLGFAKTAEQSWALVRSLKALAALGRPLLVGASRKGFLQRLLADGDGFPRTAAGCDRATAAISALLAAAGVWCVRVHDVGPSVDAVRVAAAFAAAGERA